MLLYATFCALFVRGAVCAMEIEAPLLSEVPASSSLHYLPFVSRAARVIEPFAERYGAAELAGPFAPAVAAGIAAYDVYSIYKSVKRNYGATDPGVNVDNPFAAKKSKVSSRPSSSGSYNRANSRASTADSIYRRTRSRTNPTIYRRSFGFIPLRRRRWWQ